MMELCYFKMENTRDKQTFTNGDTYKGEWKDNKMHGKGVYQFSDGAIFEGYFQNGIKCGQGIKKFPSGASYDGEWKND